MPTPDTNAFPHAFDTATATTLDADGAGLAQPRA